MAGLITPPNANLQSMDYALIGSSAVGCALIFYAYTGGRLLSLDLAPVTFENFAVVCGAAYGAGFFLVPKVLIDMNFTAKVDKYHEFLARFCGFLMLLFSYIIYAGLLGDAAFQMLCIWMGGTGLFGPTFAVRIG